MSRIRSAAGALLAACLASWAAVAPAAAEPRPLSESERRAVELAAAYLDQGPAAWWPHLAEDSPLLALGQAAALDEIGARAGPPEGALWRLETPGPVAGERSAMIAIEFPSGTGELLELGFDPDGGLVSVVSLVEPRASPGERAAPPAAAAEAASASPVAEGLEIGRLAAGGRVLAAAPVAVAILLGLLGVRWRRRRPRPRLLRRSVLRPAVLASAALLAVAFALACGGGSGSGAPASEAADAAVSIVRLAPLRPMRDAMARGEALPSPPVELTAAAAAAERLWFAERLLWEMDLDAAGEVLDGFPMPAEIPLAGLLRARLAMLRSDRLEAPAAFERALALGPDSDGLRFELAEALHLLGFAAGAEQALDELIAFGSRSAAVYYTAAGLTGQTAEVARGQELLRTAWRLEPVERAELFSSPMLAYLATRSHLFDVIGLSEPREPLVAPPVEGRRPIALPPGARPTLTGGLLRVAIGGGRLEVPGGWSLAAADTPVEDVLAARRREVEALLGESRRGGRRVAGLFAQPGRRRQLLRAALVLTRERRWSELETLTAGLGDDVARLPPDLVRLRALALKRLDRDAEATRLMVGLARAQAIGQRRDAGSLYQLGELFAASGEHELAMRLIRKAGELSPYPLGTLRLRQIALDKKLADSYRSLRSEHFDLRYPKASGDDYAGEVAQVLEAELVRLQRWIPLASVGRIEVSLFPLADFMTAFSPDFDVIGLYDGRVRVPFAHVASLHPYLVSTLSHELAHALIDQRTGGRAPDWVQEGLAQHVEMVQNQVNPIPELEARHRVLALPVVDAALDGFSDPELTELAYAQAAWTLHYVEARYGIAGIHRLLDAFAAGADSDGAVEQAFGTDLAAFDLALREWSRTEAPTTWPTELRRYDQELDSPLSRTGISRGGPATPAPRWVRRPQAAMEEWHRRYSARVAALRRGLGPAIDAVRRGAIGPDGACARVGSAAADLLAERTALASPDPAPGQTLRSAFESFRRMATACRAGDLGVARRELATAERELGRAATLLEPYGLRP